MPFRSLTRSVRDMFVGLAALTIMGLFAPGTASAAGCAHPFLKLLSASGSGGDALGFADFKASEGAAPVLPTAPPPCTGAFCSGLPATPPAPPLTLPSTSPDRWMCPFRSSIDPAAGSARIDVIDDGAPPCSIVSSLFRPPRAV